jgi:hypothetical protein
MSETRRLLEASAALSQLLRANGIPHAFYGSVLTAVLANSSHSDVRRVVHFSFPPLTSLSLGDLLHRGRRAKSASCIPPGAGLLGRDYGFHDYSLTMDEPVMNHVRSRSISAHEMLRLHVTYRPFIPAIEVRQYPLLLNRDRHSRPRRSRSFPLGRPVLGISTPPRS